MMPCTRRLHLARFALPLLLMLGGCMHHVIHQGNVLKPALVDAIQEGDSRFHVESVLGSPVLNDVLHPNRAVYVEWYRNTWKKTRPGNKPYSVYIQKGAGFRYPQSHLAKYAKPWEIEIIGRVEDVLAQVRETQKALTTARRP